MSIERQIMVAVAWADIIALAAGRAFRFLVGFIIGFLICNWIRRHIS